MNKHLIIGFSALLAVLLPVPDSGAQQRQQAQTRAQGDRVQPPPKSGLPAPRRDISGVWLGQVTFPPEPTPPLTRLGQELFDAARPLNGPRAVAIADSTDPLVTCDPLGFPRAIFYELRAFEFGLVKNKMIQLLQYQRVWREIWMDGRKLPANIGGEGDTPDPRYYGYSIGRWEDDYTFVVESTGFSENSWADQHAHPRSMNAHVEERYHRIDYDTMEITITINDPKIYTKPWLGLKQRVYWHPKQEFEEQLCIPSEALEYLSIVRPAAEGLK